MTLDGFRKEHSMLIEYYQKTEFLLEGIYAANSGRDFFETVDEVKNDTLSQLIIGIRTLQSEQGKEILSKKICKRIERIRKDRNFWVHDCYLVMRFEEKNGLTVLSDQNDFVRLHADIQRVGALVSFLEHVLKDSGAPEPEENNTIYKKE